MKYFLFLIFCWPAFCFSQETLVPGAPPDTVNLSCEGCSVIFDGMALVTGQHSIPINLYKPVKRNLLNWKYFDDVTQEEVITEEKPLWTEGKLLLDEVSPDTLLSLHINLTGIDSAGRQHHIFLVIGGMSRNDLEEMPFESHYDPNTYQLLRFSSIVQRKNEHGEKETFDCRNGYLKIEKFDLQKGTVKGKFEFTAGRFGVQQMLRLENGRFEKR